jgi:hypothetical protein
MNSPKPPSVWIKIPKNGIIYHPWLPIPNNRSKQKTNHSCCASYIMTSGEFQGIKLVRQQIS